MVEHRWDFCDLCGPMVRCGNCGNNCCNGGSGDGCPDKCASAYEMQAARNTPLELLAREAMENARQSDTGVHP